MRWFSNLKIRLKLTLGFGAVVLLSFTMGVMDFSELKKNDDDYTNLINNVISRSQAMTDIGWSFAQYRRIASTAAVQTGNQLAVDSLRSQYQIEKENIRQQFILFDSATAADVTLSDSEKIEVRKVSDTIENLLNNEYDALLNKVLDSAYDNDYDMAIENIIEMQQVAGVIDNEINDFIESTKNTVATMKDASTAMAKNSERILLILPAIVLLLGMIISLFISNIITKGINDVAEAALAISEGNFNVNVGSNGHDEIAALSNSLLKVKTVTQSLINDIGKVSDDLDAGEIDVVIDETRYIGDFKDVVIRTNKVTSFLMEVVVYMMTVVDELGNGNFDVEAREFPGKQANVTECVKNVKANLFRLNGDIRRVIDGATEGNLDTNIDTALYHGDWSKMAERINALILAIVEPVREAITVLDQLSEGNLEMSVNGDYKGEFALMKKSLNNTLAMLSSYIREIKSVLGAMSHQDLTVSIEREYVGDFSEIKTAINNILSVFNTLINEINSAASQVDSGSKQMAESSMSLAQGTAEQSSAVEQLNATIEDVSNQTIKNAENTDRANELAIDTKKTAENGNEEMKMMLNAMTEINESSTNISKIIKVIDDIAFQTNLLALNAAVEAARAGEHGKGFAVVAEEVRNLAGRSQRAAKETSALIEGSMNKVAYGSKIADNTAAALKLIVSGINSITDTMSEVALASNRQSDSIEQITIGVSQISQVTQKNSATSEEQAAAAQELSSQADLFKSIVGKFKL